MQTFIFGHRNPDTDSICSSIALSYLKNALGYKTVAKAPGHLNNETKFVLKYFNINEPQYLNDVKVRIKNIKYDKKAVVNENNTIYDAYNVMQKQSITAVPLVDNSKKLTGFVSMKDVAKFLVEGNKEDIDTTLDHILEVLDAKAITKYDDRITGKMMLIGYQNSTFADKVGFSNDTILVIGDRYKVIDYAIESKVKLIILALDNELKDDLKEKAIKNKVTIIRTNKSSFEIANVISLCNEIKSINECSNPITFYDDDFYDDFQLITKRTKHTNYPVINHKNECLGLICLNWSNEYEKQKVILVDHNNYDQSIEGINEANILEIVDHHNLGTIGTTIPISFRCKPVGCTATIIYTMYEENKVKMPYDIAGLLLSAILSDTLLFTSPSTTDEDIEVAKELAIMSKVDIKSYGYEMLKASSTISGLSVNEQIYQDYKTYTVGKVHLSISQLVTMDFDEIKNNIDEYINKLNEMNSANPGVSALFITDIIKKGSYVIYNSKSEEIIKDSFNLNEIYQGIFIPKIISRKKQMLPLIMEVLSDK